MRIWLALILLAATPSMLLLAGAQYSIPDNLPARPQLEPLPRLSCLADDAYSTLIADRRALLEHIDRLENLIIIQ